MASKVASHLTEDVSRDLKVFQHDLIHFRLTNVDGPGLFVDKLDYESALTIVIELELTILENVIVVLYIVDIFDDIVLLHSRKLNCASYSSFLANIARASAGPSNQIPSHSFRLFLHLALHRSLPNRPHHLLMHGFLDLKRLSR